MKLFSDFEQEHYERFMEQTSHKSRTERLARYKAMFRPDEWLKVGPGLIAVMFPEGLDQ